MTEPTELVVAEVEAQKWTADMSQLVFECGSVLGRELTAYVGGADHPRDLESWIDQPHEAAQRARERLTAARRITTALAAVMPPAKVVAWFREPADDLGGISPATALHRSAVPQVHALLFDRAVGHASAARLVPVG